ncbi:hypothetical protein ALC62_13837 [Cyphomyrmex costatus]|uniref:Uncharacterized protein n=1 Tax=Cyphomyrmex costatus TaxID=456900 RepID=A0A195C3G7_9HYME|nr:hypothetical protein ALC62_13837 [Cyphomyrmex costatus]
MATERKAAGDTCWRDGAAGGVHPLEKQEEKRPSPIDPVSCPRYVVAAASSSSWEPPTQIKATVVISIRGAVEAEKGGAGRMRWPLARKRLSEWSYVLDRRPSSRIEECDALLSGPRRGWGAGGQGRRI